jgi:hypothetical protein
MHGAGARWRSSIYKTLRVVKEIEYIEHMYMQIVTMNAARCIRPCRDRSRPPLFVVHHLFFDALYENGFLVL